MKALLGFWGGSSQSGAGAAHGKDIHLADEATGVGGQQAQQGAAWGEIAGGLKLADADSGEFGGGGGRMSQESGRSGATSRGRPSMDVRSLADSVDNMKLGTHKARTRCSTRRRSGRARGEAARVVSVRSEPHCTKSLREHRWAAAPERLANLHVSRGCGVQSWHPLASPAVCLPAPSWQSRAHGGQARAGVAQRRAPLSRSRHAPRAQARIASDLLTPRPARRAALRRLRIRRRATAEWHGRARRPRLLGRRRAARRVQRPRVPEHEQLRAAAGRRKRVLRRAAGMLRLSSVVTGARRGPCLCCCA